jgi:hypothetical protein
MERKPFPLKARWLIGGMLAIVFTLPAYTEMVRLLGAEEAPWYWGEVTFSIYIHIVELGLILALARWVGIDLREMLLPARGAHYKAALQLALWVLVLGVGLFYVVYIPLSFVAPAFVQTWVLDYPPLIYSDAGNFPVIANLMGFLVVVGMAPVVEELIFRGFLLHRWIDRWGTYKGILASSLLFGLMHPDPLGATIFGIAMCVLYLRSQTLLVPMLGHAFNNLVAYNLEALTIAMEGPEFERSVARLQSEWLWGLGTMLIAMFWAQWWMRRASGPMPLQLPVLSCQSVAARDSESGEQ